ncbi:MAG: GIY-YIG nuclease family protein [Alphaproteobacteria bacterium]|nr:GIY-YIG nuclease family protein [Alphaproteobacteria bacterium]
MDNEPGAYIYMLRCSDGSYYVGSARRGLDRRIAEHNDGKYGGFTSKRLPVVLVWAEHFPDITDAIAVERQIKGWSRAKKEALIRGDYGALRTLSSRGGGKPSTDLS